MNLISVIIVTHNSQTNIQACLDTVLAQNYQAGEIVVIDNASRDETREIVRNKYPGVVLIENSQNYGYPKALNQGIVKTQGEFILCLNDDARLAGVDFLTLANEAMKKNQRIGVIQPKMFKPDGTIDTTGICLTFLRRYYDLNSGKIDAPELNIKKYIFGACNAVVLYRRQALEQVKQGQEYFDEDFFGLVEDVDLSWRMQKKSWATLYEPELVSVHMRGLSRRRDSFTQYLNMRNRYLMIIKNESLVGFLRYPFVFLIYDLWRVLLMLIINPKYFFQAVYQIVVLLPKMFNKRRIIT